MEGSHSLVKVAAAVVLSSISEREDEQSINVGEVGRKEEEGSFVKGIGSEKNVKGVLFLRLSKFCKVAGFFPLLFHSILHRPPFLFMERCCQCFYPSLSNFYSDSNLEFLRNLDGCFTD